MKVSWGGDAGGPFYYYSIFAFLPHMEGGCLRGGGRGCGQLNFLPAKHPSGNIQECPDSNHFFRNTFFFVWGLVWVIPQTVPVPELFVKIILHFNKNPADNCEDAVPDKIFLKKSCDGLE